MMNHSLTTSFLRYFRIQVVLRILGICLTIGLGVYVLIPEWEPLVIFLIMAFIALQVAALIRHLERSTRDLLSFLEAIEFSDFTQSFSAPYEERHFKNLYGAFSRVMQPSGTPAPATRPSDGTWRRSFITWVPDCCVTTPMARYS